MRKALFAIATSVVALTAGAAPAAADPAAVKQAVAADYDSHLEDLFVHFHANPELSFLEVETAQRMAVELKAAGLEVTEGGGGTGVVGMVRNGDGPLILLRADMDGLPMPEKTGLDYASTATQVGQDGNEYPVMHACGHDVHITSMVGTARRLMAMRDHWSGTLMFVVQPAEERVGGAAAMLEDGLYERFGTPDYALAFHVASILPTGKISASESIQYSSADSVDIKVPGVGAHGASPHYHVTEDSNAPILPGQLFLIDSGGQYADGTTDVTRTVAIGAPTEQMRTRFTQVLQGHIAIATAVVPVGSCGSQIDTLARMAL